MAPKFGTSGCDPSPLRGRLALMWLFPEFAGFVTTHGAALILPAAVIEGPIVAVLAGALAARGYLDWRWVLVLLILGDLIGDAIHYAIGRFARAPLTALGRRCGLDPGRAMQIAVRLRADATRMLFVGKWTHAIGGFVLIGAGVLRQNPVKFLLVNLAATIPKSAVLLGIGYFAGNVYPLVARHVILGTAVLLCLGAAAVAVLLLRGGGVAPGGPGR